MAQYPYLQVVTYHWSEADNSMICASMGKSNEQDYPASATASISTGALKRLPLELIHNVLGHLDISTIGSVRCLSWNSRLIVDLFPPYRDLTIYASSVLRVLYSTHLASAYSVGQLYTVLTNDRCICCEAFGPYLSLITCERCCFSCLYDSKMAPTTLSTAASAFGLSKNEIEKKIPVVTTLPGMYTIERTEKKRILKVVSVRKALALALEKQNKTQPVGEDLTNLDENAKDLIKHYNDPIRFMVSTPIPYLNTRNHHTESGVWCRGCELVWYRNSSRKWSSDCYKRVLDTAYLEEEYLLHFEECEAAKELWGLFLREGKGLEHLHRGRHREWASRNVER
ncbi:hypothetical protein ONS95_014222 [Cadophora gregata]|uniref:uncharacterized protein n=1 Tax=Cadophora gregata TaxID=51156 RepID=UPI0026DD7FD6|nr:uncharacterized protein ONS95_014222 [Cadophora gregata]KAK0113979.1 hypothetical protein ONS96_014826 [Cadophora gregata f. sp. sojae]KAK0114737.1 hypothetical protein ONS95_014222 [Cadophora gregata]